MSKKNRKSKVNAELESKQRCLQNIELHQELASKSIPTKAKTGRGAANSVKHAGKGGRSRGLRCPWVRDRKERESAMNSSDSGESFHQQGICDMGSLEGMLGIMKT